MERSTNSHIASFPLVGVITALCEDDQLLNVPVHAALRYLVSVGGRCPHGLDALSVLDRLVFAYAAHAPLLRLTRHPDSSDSLVVYYNSFGRLHIRATTAPFVDYGVGRPLVVGYFSLPPHFWLKINRAWHRRKLLDRLLTSEFIRALMDVESRGALDTLLCQMIDAVQRVEAVFWYVNDLYFAAVERFTNLVDTRRRGGVLNELKGKPLSIWTQDCKFLVAALHCLFLSGKSIRLEEFNGTNVTASSIHIRLRALARMYTPGVGADTLPGPIFALARLIGKSSTQFIGRTQIRYRETNGISFRKVERLTLSSTLAVHHDFGVGSLEQEWLGSKTGRHIYAVMLDLSDHAIEAAVASATAGSELLPSVCKLDTLLEAVVASAVVTSHSDYGMSSAVRTPNSLYHNSVPEIANSVLNLTPNDFFCCIVCTAGLAERYEERLSKEVFRPVQARMQFNRWHFIPGNLPRDTIKDGRHFFFPPTMPDIANWSDQFHAAHATAGVRYAVRAPGPDTHQPPLYVCGIPYRGFYDCRVVRTDGQPYTVNDMLVVNEHARLIGILWSRIVFYCDRFPIARPQLAFRRFQNGQGMVLPADQLVGAI